MKNNLKKSFPKPPLLPGEALLQQLQIPYEIQKDGSLRVEGNIELNDQSLDTLPDFSNVALKGSFLVRDNNLTSLKGAPKSVTDRFDCSYNKLTSLEHAPSFVGGIFQCNDNQLTTLKGSPKSVGLLFICTNNEITTLEGSPEEVGGHFCCAYNSKLKVLEGAPKKFEMIACDLGNFSSWDEVPEHLRLSEKTKQRLIEEERQLKKEKEKMKLERSAIHTKEKINKLKNKKSSKPKFLKNRPHK